MTESGVYIYYSECELKKERSNEGEVGVSLVLNG